MPYKEPDELSYASFLRQHSQDADQEMLKHAWMHYQFSHDLVINNKDLFSEIKQDGAVETKNKMGFHTGFCPEAALEIFRYFKPEQPLKILEIGSGYGFDSIALANLFPKAQITCIEIDPDQVDVMSKIMSRLNGPEIGGRIQPYVADFLKSGHLNLMQNQYDLIILSKVLHFYSRKDMDKFFRKVSKLLKPGAMVIITSVSDKTSPFVYYSSKFFGERLPMPSMIKSAFIPSFQWVTFSNPGLMNRLSRRNGLESLKNMYIAKSYYEPTEASPDFFSPNYENFMLLTVLQKPF